ncbi:hypothetical protein LUZ62_059132 [Rhynchospora pubera]|uniref:Transcription initiation factor IIF subunit alpha n=1 Tax=Rhynchospora pubera TaxID=906938 RepID=A0AAV8E061_9POAL|nr:hypothetical protein LUZ62_059132 [Rhynchospora pubera]
MNYNPNYNPNMNNMRPSSQQQMMMGSGSGGGGGGNPYNPQAQAQAAASRAGKVGGDLVLKASCEVCGNASELYGSGCKHMTLCLSCGKRMAADRHRCNLCAAPITNLIREYNVRAANASTTDKTYSIGRFVSGIPPFSLKRSAEVKWSLHKDGVQQFQGRQLTEAQKEKLKNKPWILEDETGQHQFQGQLEGSHSRTATYYLLMLQGREFQAYPAGSWFNFSKVAQYKQLTIEEAEAKMSKRRSNATGYERWMMKAAANGAAAFGLPIEKKPGEGAADTKDPAEAASRGKKGKKGDGQDDEKGDEDEDEEAARRDRLSLTKKGIDDDEDGGGKRDIDLDDDDILIEKGDDWEHEEIFTDDDEAVGNDPEEREDLLAPDIPAPPEIKQDDEEEEGEENGGLSKSGKELKKLLGKAAGLESDAEDDDDDDEQEDEASPVLAPKKKEAVKDEPDVDKSSNKPEDTKPGKGGKGTPASSKSNKGKRKSTNEESKPGSNVSSKKPKSEPVVVKEEIPTPSKSGMVQKGSSGANKGGTSPSVTSTSPVTEEEIRTVLLSSATITTQELVGQFKSRLRNSDDKKAFTDILKRISKITKNSSGTAYVVLK